MKKKGFNSLLIFMVIFVWLFVFKKTFSFFDSNQTDLNPSQNIEVAYITALEFRKDTFDIHDYDRDPFLDANRKKRIVLSKKTGVPKKVAVKKAKKTKVSKTKWPKLQYFGYLKGGGESKKLALIKIDNKLHRVRERQSINEIYVKTVFKDSVVLRMDDETRTVQK